MKILAVGATLAVITLATGCASTITSGSHGVSKAGSYGCFKVGDAVNGWAKLQGEINDSTVVPDDVAKALGTISSELNDANNNDIYSNKVAAFDTATQAGSVLAGQIRVDILDGTVLTQDMGTNLTVDLATAQVYC